MSGIQRYQMPYARPKFSSGGSWMTYADHQSVVDAHLQQIEKLRAALTSIAKNTCCDRCQEAALVARAALAESEVPR